MLLDIMTSASNPAPESGASRSCSASIAWADEKTPRDPPISNALPASASRHKDVVITDWCGIVNACAAAAAAQTHQTEARATDQQHVSDERVSRDADGREANCTASCSHIMCVCEYSIASGTRAVAAG
jgi:hypothetical protein